MNKNQLIQHYHSTYTVLHTVDLDHWHTLPIYQRDHWLRQQLTQCRRDCYEPEQRLLFTITQDTHSTELGTVLRTLQTQLNSVDITNFFVILLIPHSWDLHHTQRELARYSQDPTSMTIDQFQHSNTDLHCDIAEHTGGYNYNSTAPQGVDTAALTAREGFLLTQSRTFCILPWIHLHAFPTGQAYPCCHSDMNHALGSVRENTLAEIWNSPAQRELRTRMLTEQPSAACQRCYEQESVGFFSGRRSANKHHARHIGRVAETHADGRLDRFEMTYWDIRFSNLCNLKCRSCGHIFSSQWYQDQARLAGPEWRLANSVLNYAGRDEGDMWTQLIPHLDYVEQIYFAGGEPLLMEEHYRILEELLRRGRTDVRLIYNTNFTHTDLKGRSVFEYWKQFQSVAVGASLDDMGSRGEYIRKGTAWGTVERNRELMLQICPQVDFYISPTLSIMNARHLPKFHRVWVERGFIRPQDLNVNILQDPPHYRIDIAPPAYKAELTELYQAHIEWLRRQGDPLGRATQGFESAVAFLNATDNTALIPKFWAKTRELDEIRNENILSVIPELGALQ